MKFLGLLVLGLAPLCASTITSVSASNTNPFSVTYVDDTATEASMASRLFISASFVGGGSANCTWANTTPPATPNCSSASNFSVSFTNGDDTHIAADSGGFWTVINLNGNALLSITLDGVHFASGVGFDRCTSGSGFGTPDDDNSSCGTNGGGTVGTPGSNVGYSVASTTFGPNDALAAIATYSSPLNVSPNPARLDAFGVLTLNFGAGLAANTDFTFVADTDLVNNVQAGVPEPGSLALLGSGLIGLAALARRRRKQ